MKQKLCSYAATHRTLSLYANGSSSGSLGELDMRTVAAVVALSIVAASSLALADAWKAKVALEPGSPPACHEADVSDLFFDLTQSGSELLIKTNTGGSFSAPIAADGSVTTTFIAPVGAKKFSMDLTGNVNTRQFEALNRQYSCRFKLIPV
jgi:hypothetical protein